MKDKEKVLIAMSGGVDSAVAALLMIEAGCDCAGATMKLFDGRDDLPCCSAQDIADAQKISESLGIRHDLYDFSDCFEETVVKRFAEAYENGRTPNPCVDCNRYLKFEKLFAKARETGYDAVATGHYVRCEQDMATGRYLLKKALDPAKDQSYVLWSLTQEQLAHARFPLGGITKETVRKIAEEHGFVNADKRESQDICFVPDGDYAAFLEHYTKKCYPSGNFATLDGKVIGRHKGIIRYTVGQRRGLGLALPEPLYVCSVDPASNTVFLGKNEDLFGTSLIAHHVNLISVSKIEGSLHVKAKIRYRQKEEWATVSQPEPDTLLVNFEVPQRAITKGQSVVLYDGDTVVGGGIID